jgi:hypothetical protein
MKLLIGWSRCTGLGLLVMSLGLTLTPTPSGYAQTPKVLRVGLAEDPDILAPTFSMTILLMPLRVPWPLADPRCYSPP